MSRFNKGYKVLLGAEVRIDRVVVKGVGDELVYVDGRTWEEAQIYSEDAKVNLLKTIFKDGEMTKEQSLSEIRNVLHGGKF